jgi:hypothetical protein
LFIHALLESAKYLRKDLKDSVARAAMADCLYAFFIQKNGAYLAAFPSPHVSYPGDVNSVLAFYHNIPVKNLAKISKLFYEEHLSPRLKEALQYRIADLNKYLETPMTYEEWRAQRKAKRVRKASQD